MNAQQTQTVQRQEIQIGFTTVLAFRQGLNDYFLNMSQLGALIGKPDNSALRFLESKGFKAKHGEAFSALQIIDESGRKYSCLPLWVVKEYLFNWAYKGNLVAQTIVESLAEESLEIRCQVAFNENSPEASKESQGTTNQRVARSIQELTEYRKAIGKAWLDKFAGGKIHDRLTLLVFGQTASQAILVNPLVDGRPTVGLDHQADPELMEILIDCKVESLRYKKGTHEEMIDRAYATVMKRRSQRQA